MVDWFPSLEGDILAYTVTGGADADTRLFVVEVDSGATLDGPITVSRSCDVAWLAGGRQLVYIRPPADTPRIGDVSIEINRRVWLHTVGSPSDSPDVELLGNDLDETNLYWFASSPSADWLVVHAVAGTSPRTEVWLAEITHAGLQELRPVQTGVDAWTLAWVCSDRLYLLTDRDAPRGRLCATDPRPPGYPAWTTVIPEQADAILSDAVVLDGGVTLASHAYDAVSRLAWFSAEGAPLGEVDGLGTGAVAALLSCPEGGRQAWIAYQDFVTPPLVLVTSLDTPTKTAVWADAPGQRPPVDVHVVERHYPSVDGTGIHVFIVSPAAEPDERRATLLVGYGGFNSLQAPAYSAATLAWVEAGGVWAIANVRGGSEHGEEWHRSGTRADKQRSFDDFTAVAAGLASDGWTDPDHLGVMGASNGGLLVGAALVQHPELFAAAVCASPLLDMVRYERFGAGRSWSEEYGSAEIAEELEWLLAYSPYHHVEPGVAYPAVLFTVSGRDDRVDPMHARKMCAALQHASASSRPIVFRLDAEAGHVAQTVTEAVDLATDQLAFLAHQLQLRSLLAFGD